MATEYYSLTVRGVRRETPDAVSITLDVPAEQAHVFQWKAGQHLALRAMIDGVEARRTYSICSGPDEPSLQIAVKHLDGGLFSTFANRLLKAGDTIDAMAPAGRFVLPPLDTAPSRHRQILAIAAGSGITPVLAIIKTALARDPLVHITLLFGNRDCDHILFRTQLEDLKDQYLGRLTVTHALSREYRDLTLLDGRIDAEKITVLARPLLAHGGIDLAFLCGPTPLLKVARATLEGLGVPRDSIRVEIFHAGVTTATTAPARPPAEQSRPDRTGSQATMTLNGRQTIVVVGDGESVLAAALRAGLDAPYSCRGGMCCTCRAKLSEGTVAMAANYSLEPWEVAAGFILTCQARATSRKLGIDYDAH